MAGRPIRWVLSLAVMLVACAQATPSVAAEWHAPVEGCVELLGYGAAYAAGTHRGVDLAAGEGATVVAPAAGTVTFAGSVPADGGGTCGAITIEIADGLRVSLMPLEEMFVGEGAAIGAGDELGSLALRGDDSSAQAHLHLSLRRGDAYLDPSGLMARDEGRDDQSQSAPPATHAPPTGTPSSAGAAVSSGVTSAIPAMGASAVSATVPRAPAPAPGDVITAPASGAGRVVSGRSPIEGAGVPAPSTLDPTAGRVHVRRATASSPLPLKSATSAVLLLGMCAVAGVIAFTRRAAPVPVD